MLTSVTEREILGSDMSELNNTPNANRIHIGIFGRTNSGKSTFINSFTGQQVSIVSKVAGTTTDPVYKAMEINPLGPCVIIDTAGLEDKSELGSQRQEKTELAMAKTDIAVIVLPAEGSTDCTLEINLAKGFAAKKIPVLCIFNTFGKPVDADMNIREQALKNALSGTKKRLLRVDCSSETEVQKLRMALAELMPEEFGPELITGGLLEDGDMVLLVMPQDIQAPKNRLILPQVQTIRELLDRKCTVVCTVADRMKEALSRLSEAPKLIITDSQVFGYVYDNKPAESMLTSFSVLFAAYKGDLQYYIEGARHIDSLTENSRVLIAECCTHAPLAEDIGRVKIPNMLKKRFGAGMKIDVKSGTDFPSDPGEYDLIIQCGGCMFNRRYILSRIQKAKDSQVPMTNYGVTIAHITGILDKIATI